MAWYFGLTHTLACALLSASTSTTAPPRAAGASDDGPAAAPALELSRVLEAVLAHNPDLAELRARRDAAVARASAAGRLPDLELQYQTAGAPLDRPWALGDAEWHMLGLRQSIPAPRALDARARTAGVEVEMARETERTRRAELVLAARRAFADYHRADREYRAHEEHGALSEQVLELARSAYRTGRGSVTDVLRSSLERARLHRSQLDLDQERSAARGLINTLMGRAADAPLGPPGELSASTVPPDPGALEAALDRARPELLLAAQAVRRGEATLEGAEAAAAWPSFMVGVDYMFMPRSEMAHAYGAMVGLNLPWLSSRRADEVREAEHALTADRRALASVRSASRLQLRDAMNRRGATERSLAMLDAELLPRARETFEAARAAYAAGTADALSVLEALRAYLEVHIEAIRARATLAIADAELERAVGTAPPYTAGSTLEPADAATALGAGHE